MPADLTPAERVVQDLLPDALVFSAPIARDIVAAVRPLLFRDAADVAEAEIARYDEGSDGWTACRNIADELRRTELQGRGDE